jgi:plastocyanin
MARRPRLARLLVTTLLAGAGALGSSGPIGASAAAQVTAAGGTCAGGGSLGWTNGDQVVTVGDTVNWTNCAGLGPGTGGNHTLQSASAGWCLADNTAQGTSGRPWSFACKFTAAGSFKYVCGVHGASMSGVVTVRGAQPPPSAPTPTHSNPPAAAGGAAQPAPQQPSPRPTRAATPPSAGPGPALEAVAPSPTPADARSPDGRASAPPTTLPSAPSGTGGGPGIGPLLLVGLGMVALAGGAGFYWYRGRSGA